MSYQISQNLSLNIYNRWLLAKNSNIFTSIKWEKFRLGSTKLIFHFLFGLSYIGVINTNIVWSFGPVSNKFGCGLRRNLLVCGMKNNLPLASRHLLMMWYLNKYCYIYWNVTDLSLQYSSNSYNSFHIDLNWTGKKQATDE